jgi:hypothetical protein
LGYNILAKTTVLCLEALTRNQSILVEITFSYRTATKYANGIQILSPESKTRLFLATSLTCFFTMVMPDLIGLLTKSLSGNAIAIGDTI